MGNPSAPMASDRTYFAAACAHGRCVARVANVGTGIDAKLAGAQATDRTVAGAEAPLGILQGAVEAGELGGDVATHGPAKGVAGAAIAATDTFLTTDANGKLIPAANGELYYAINKNLGDAVDGDEIDIFVTVGQL